MSGIGGEVTEVDELLSMMREAREEHEMQKKQHCQSIYDREQSKLAAGASLVEKATNSGAVLSSDGKKKHG